MDEELLVEDPVFFDEEQPDYEIINDEPVLQVEEIINEEILDEVPDDLPEVTSLEPVNDNIVADQVIQSVASADSSDDVYALVEAVNHNIVILNDNINLIGTVSIAVSAMMFGGIAIYCWLGGLR